MAFNNSENPNNLSDEELKQFLLTGLASSLSPDQNLRCDGENKLKVLEVTEDYGVLLAQIALDTSGDLAIRQLASVLLRQYIKNHWSTISDNFQEPVVTPQAKHTIKQMLPIGLSDENLRIRTAAANAMSAAAHWDWPDEWPELLTFLTQALSSDLPQVVQGAMCVLVDFSKDLTDQQIIHVGPTLLPRMLQIAKISQQYSVEIQTKAVKVFNTCVSLILAIDDENATKSLLPDHFIQEFTMVFSAIITTTIDSAMSFGLLKEILTLLTAMIKDVINQSHSDLLNLILSSVWQLLSNAATYYLKNFVYDECDDTQLASDGDGDTITFDHLTMVMFEFIECLFDSKYTRKVLIKSMNELMYLLIMFMQMTEEQSIFWNESSENFADCDDDNTSLSTRLNALDLMIFCSEQKHKKEITNAVVNAVQRHIAEAQVKKSSDERHWWKINEACYLAVGSLHDALVPGKVQLDIVSFIGDVVVHDLQALSFLAGRALWMASCFTTHLPEQLLSQLLVVIDQGMQPKQSHIIKINAAKAVFNFYKHLEGMNNVNPIYRQHATSLLENFFHLANDPSVKVLALAVENICTLIDIFPDIAFNYQDHIVSLAHSIFLNHSNDPLLSALVPDLLTGFMAHGVSVPAMEEKLIPTLANIMTNKDNSGTHIVPVALELLGSIVKKSKSLSPALLEIAFPQMMHCVLESEDYSVLQSGGDCARAYLINGTKQLMQWHDGSGQNGLFYVLKLISVLLSPKLNENSATFAGRLVSVFLSNCQEDLSTEHVHMILRSVLSKLEQAKTLTVAQSLLSIFAHLVAKQVDVVVSFLSDLPGPSGDSALHFVMNEWCDKQSLFFGSYVKKLNVFAMSKLLEYGVTTNDSRMMTINVKGEEIYSEKIRTRSQRAAAPKQWTVVPLLVKLYKLLLSDFSNYLESKANEKGCDEDDYTDVESDEEEDNIQSKVNSLVSDYLNDDLEEIDDDDIVNENISNLDILDYLKTFLAQFVSTEAHGTHFASYLSNSEEKLLKQSVFN